MNFVLIQLDKDLIVKNIDYRLTRKLFTVFINPGIFLSQTFIQHISIRGVTPGWSLGQIQMDLGTSVLSLLFRPRTNVTPCFHHRILSSLNNVRSQSHRHRNCLAIACVPQPVPSVCWRMLAISKIDPNKIYAGTLKTFL